MSITTTDLSPALRRALSLLVSPPPAVDAYHGYLNLLGEHPSEPSGPIQSLWASKIGSALYDHVQSLGRRVVAVVNPPPAFLRLPWGGRVLDIGCGPGNVTGGLGRVVGPHGLALGLDVSAAMLERAVRAHATDNVGFLRADARELPFRDGGFDAVISLLALQLIPEPLAALGEMSRVLVPGALLGVLVPTVVDSLLHRVSNLLGNPGHLEFFHPDEVADTLDGCHMRHVHTQQNGPFLWIIARKA